MRVKFSGMCCTITMPGQSWGMPTRNSRIASVPPVEAPTAISLSEVFTPRGTGRFTIRPGKRDRVLRIGSRGGIFRRALLAARIFSAICAP
jgi:hypothetical protein